MAKFSRVPAERCSKRALLDEIAAAERGDKPQPAAVENAFSVAIAPDGASLENVIIGGAVPERFRLDELRSALQGWITAIERPRDGTG
jgi:hypothetical protein